MEAIDASLLRAELEQAATVCLFRVQDAKDDDAVADHLVEYSIGKTCDQDAAETSKVAWAQFRVGCQGAQRKRHRIKELVAKSGAFPLLPLARLGQILFGLRSQVE